MNTNVTSPPHDGKLRKIRSRLHGTASMDEHGVTRHWGPWKRSARWSEIIDYRLEVTAGRVVNWYSHGEILDIADPLRLRRAFNPQPLPVHVSARFVTARGTVRISARIPGSLRFILAASHRVSSHLRDGVDRELRRQKGVSFGPLRLSESGISWADKALVPRDRVEVVELFNTWPPTFRVMVRDKVFPYGKARLGRIPDPIAAFVVAARLGYTVRGADWLLGG